MDDCEFCQIINRLTPAEVVYESRTTLAFFPLEPATRGHTLVIPKRHVENFLVAEPADLPGLSTAVVLVGKALDTVLRPQGMNIISSAGEAASQSVMHLHVHLVPRWNGDAVGEIWPPKTITASEVLEDVADAVREFCRTQSLEDRNPKQNQPHTKNHGM